MTIRKAITVARPPDVAFRVFTEEIGKWWPLREGFSFGRERAQDLILEGRVGGRFFERFTDGTEFEVGRVTAFQPPHLVSLTWKAPDWEGPTDIEVRFVAEGSGTRVESSIADSSRARSWKRLAKVLERMGRHPREV